jgi:ribosomal protein S12 methylthiotransferase accessory factor YcaO
LAAVGLDQNVVVDLSSDQFPCSVVKVVVPGMEGYLVDGHTPGPRARHFAQEQP